MPEIFGRSVRAVSATEVIQHVVNNPRAFVLWLGAGASVEAGVKSSRAVCDEICARLVAVAKPADVEAWKRAELNWNDDQRRYSTSLVKYAPTPAQRVRYFRELIDGVQPSFAHHAVALLMGAGLIKQTCLTTNFDKLIEMAFAQQGYSEFQAIRSDDEARFHRQLDDKCYVVKLHGDYDTHNIRNTLDEVTRIPKGLQDLTAELLEQAGLILMGSSGYEPSVLRMLDEILGGAGEAIPNMGLYWGVNVGDCQTDDEIAKRLRGKLEAGSISREAIEMMSRFHSAERPCAVFPIPGAGQFLFDLVRATDNKAVMGRARRFLDHPLRLRHLFREGGLDSEAVNTRLSKLDSHTRRRTRELHQRSQTACAVWQARTGEGRHEVLILYGDITSRSLMDSPRFSTLRRAVISPDDNFISVGGGAALELLRKAGPQILLHELSKFQVVEHREVVVTSGGDLPVHYVLHAAATRLHKDGRSDVTPDDVTETVKSALVIARNLGVKFVFTPLIAAGTEGMDPADSVKAILAAFMDVAHRQGQDDLGMAIVIRDEATLPRADARACLQQALAPEFAIRPAPA